MNLAGRLRALERVTTPVGVCSECGGKGPTPRVLVWHQDRGDPKPEHPVCPACGRGPGVVRLIILGDGP